MTTRIIAWMAAIGFLASGAGVVSAQPKRPRAELTPVVETASIRAGQPVRLALRVKLPPDVHVQSDKPKDPALIPTVLTIEAPAGVTLEKTSYPPATELVQAGQSLPLAVLGPEFTIDVSVAIASTVTAGPLTIPVRLRYQACDDKVCYPPARADAQWALNVEK